LFEFYENGEEGRNMFKAKVDNAKEFKVRTTEAEDFFGIIVNFICCMINSDGTLQDNQFDDIYDKFHHKTASMLYMQDEDGNTMLHNACAGTNTRKFAQYVRYNPDYDRIKNKGGETPADLLKKNQDNAMLEVYEKFYPKQ
jgi:hypothetical protein